MAYQKSAGDEIIVAGQRFHTGTRVVTWLDPDGYNAYRGAAKTARQAVNAPGATPLKSYSSRLVLPPNPPGLPTLPTLQRMIDQFVLHYDACGLSRICFEVLQQRNLSVHFMLDVDGTIYQTLDLRERAFHATTSNDRSIGVEIANIGAYGSGDAKGFAAAYQREAAGQTRLRFPPGTLPGFTGRPARADPVRGVVQGKELVQYDLTPEQYAALTKLTAALCRVFPKIKCDYPHDAAGRLITQKLSDAALAKYQGILGHYHIQDNKLDPGPALQWDRLIDGARRLK